MNTLLKEREDRKRRVRRRKQLRQREDTGNWKRKRWRALSGEFALEETGRGCRPVARQTTSQWRALWRAKSYALVRVNTSKGRRRFQYGRLTLKTQEANLAVKHFDRGKDPLLNVVNRPVRLLVSFSKTRRCKRPYTESITVLSETQRLIACRLSFQNPPQSVPPNYKVDQNTYTAAYDKRP